MCWYNSPPLRMLRAMTVRPHNSCEGYQRLSDALTEEQIVLSDIGIKYALAQITENDRDELEHDPQIVAAMEQLKVLELFAKGN